MVVLFIVFLQVNFSKTNRKNMAEEIRFTSNYHDLSTDTGFQFEFYCDHCGVAYRSTFDDYGVGAISNILDSASGLLGGIFSSASHIGHTVKSAKWQKDHDEAFVKAIKEMEPKFIQCPHCNKWVCRSKCWNVKKGLCKECAPDLGVEMAAAQMDKSKQEIWAHAHMAEEDKKLSAEYWRDGVVASCPNCEKPLEKNAKFCPECGTKLHTSDKCSECGAKLTKGAKFCPECGQKV